MVIIKAVVQATSIMEQCEQSHDQLIARMFGKIQTVSFDAGPVVETMDRVLAERKLPGQLILKDFPINVHINFHQASGHNSADISRSLYF